MIEPDIAFACDAILARPASRKLIIQIPCYNEAGTLAIALDALPRSVPGFDAVEWLIIDDGSTDATVAVARHSGADHIVSHPVNRGLAAAFKTGLETALALGADVIVNTDADNQYDANDIPTLTRPILDREADMVVGARPINNTEHFSWLKKRLQGMGSWVVRVASKTQIADAPSGFRAFTAEAAMRLNVFGAYTYTLETIIQAGLSDLKIVSVPVRTNPDLRPSRLVRSIPTYVRRSVGTIFHMFLIYRPLALFVGVGMAAITVGLALGARFLYFLATGNGEGHIQSIVLAALAIILGALTLVMAMVANLISVNRKLGEQILFRIRRLERTQHTRDWSVTSDESNRLRKRSS
jgi:glycosyltransferase involved in cell wall biosynthesis